MFNQYPGVNNQALNQEGNCGCQCQNQNMNYNNQQQNTCNPYTNVINKYYYQDVAVPMEYHTHIINNCVKRYYTVPYCTYSEETVYVDAPCQCQCQNVNRF